jgi:Domain of unknown function (DUF5134)
MGPPAWLYYLFALAMFGVAAYGLALLAISFVARDRFGRDVDIAHFFMGLSMGGMFEAHWTFWPSWFWEAVFGILLIWFVARSFDSIHRFGIHIPHEAIHAAMSLAMLFMYWYPVGASQAAIGMSMSSSSSHAMLDPGIGFLLILVFVCSAIFTLASPIKGSSHHGSHALQVPAYAGATSSFRDNASRATADPHESWPGFASVLARPRLEDLSHVVMCLGMAFMLTLML